MPTKNKVARVTVLDKIRVRISKLDPNETLCLDELRGINATMGAIYQGCTRLIRLGELERLNNGTFKVLVRRSHSNRLNSSLDQPR